MRYFLFSCTLFMLAACASQYKHLTPTSEYNKCFEGLKPKPMSAAWFDASVEVEGHHLGGLILIKSMPDESSRVVFTSEAGATLFDFEYHRNGTFKIRHIMSKLDRKVVVNVLRDDFALLLGIPFLQGKVKTFETSDEVYFESPAGNKRAFIVADKQCQPKRLEEGSKRTRLFSVIRTGADLNYPDIITITHYTFDMVIDLKRFEKNATQ
jgi:hypothetical protein